MNHRDTAGGRRRVGHGIVPFIVLTALGLGAAGTVARGAPEALELLGSVTTPTSLSLARWGDLTLVGSASGLVVEDLRDPLAASILHTLELGFRVEAIEAVGDTAVARGPDGASALIRLDGPAGPESIESPTSHALPNAWVGGLPFRVVHEDGELRVFALASGDAVPVGALPVDGAPVALAVDGTTVYLLTFATPLPLAESYTPVVAVSVADPAHPVAVGRWEPPVVGAQHETYHHLAARDGWVYLVGRLEPVLGVVQFLRPVDFRAPAAPTGQRTVNTGQVITPRDLALDGDRAVVGGSGASGAATALRVYNIADPTAVLPWADFTNDEAYLLRLDVRNGRIFAATTSGVRLLDIGPAPAQLFDLGLPLPYLTGDKLAASVETAWLLGDAGPLELLTVDAADPAAPAVAQRLPLDGSYVAPQFVERAGTALYLVRRFDRIGLIDLSDRLHAAPAGAWVMPDLADLQVDGDRVAVARTSGAQFYDATADPLHPVLHAAWPAGLGCSYAWWGADGAVAALDGPYSDPHYAGLDTLVTLDLAVPAAPALLGRVSFYFDVDDACTRGSCLFIQDQQVSFDPERGSAVVDFSAAASPTFAALSSAWPAEKFWGPPPYRPVTVLGQHCASYEDSVFVYSLDDPARPRVVAGWQAPGDVTALATAGDRVYVLTSGRLSVLRFHATVTPVFLQAFAAARVADGARVRWETAGGGELAALGLWRESPGGLRELLARWERQPTGPGEFADRAAPAGAAAYWLAFSGDDGAAQWAGPAP
ncbi:MAG: LVIVD repeat-containing protein, partial [Candidatus Krumholzibacteriia bacterium]